MTMKSSLVIHQTFKLLRRNYSKISVETLLNEENKQKTLESFRKLTKLKYGKKLPSRHAAILVPICISDKNEISVLYTLRSSKLRTHKGQIAFPGGVMDDSDGHEVECALRETEEEIGIKPEFITVWGAGSQITPSFETSVVPVIAEIRNFSPSMLKANPEEVDEIFTIDLERLINPKFVRHTQFRTSSGAGYVMPCYLGGPKKFWGMTAVVTHFLLSSLLPNEIYRHKLPFITGYSSK